MEMHKKCSCNDWRVYPSKYKLATLFICSLFLAVIGGLVFVGWKLSGNLEALKQNISLSTPWIKETLALFIGFAIFSLYAFFVYKLPQHFRAWGKSICPKCEKGYIVQRGVNPVKAVFYFVDNFLFGEILIPMFRTITFQHFWRSGYKSSKGFISKFFTFILQIFLFFGAIPFLIFLLGQDNIMGLVCAIAVVLYIMYTIVARRESDDLDYQKSVVFLMMPLYYVSMVEIFRWAFLFSPEAATLVPDRSDFLFLGIQNFIRTQLFLDLLDAVNIANLEVSGYLFLGATFVTRLLLDVAVISLLIKAGVESYRRTWVYYHTGRQIKEVGSKETLFDLENLVIVGNPSKIEEVREKLSEVMRVLGLVRPYAENVHQMDDSESRIQAQECLNQLTGVNVDEQTGKTVAKNPWYNNALSLTCVALWSFAFVWGIQFFIDEIIKVEIKELMEKAESQTFLQDPIGRQQLYVRVLQKDANHDEAMLKSSENYLKLAELNERVFSYQQAEKDVDDAFIYLRKLDENAAFKQKYQKELLQKSGEAYAIRGRLFFLQNDIERALEELRKRKTQDTRRMLFDIQLYNASLNLFTPQAPEYFALATQELGFDLEYEFTYIQTLLQSIYSAYNKDFSAFITQLQPVIEDRPKSFTTLYPAFANALAHALVRQGEKNYESATKLFKEVYNNDLYSGQAKYSALLGMANLYSLRGQFADAKLILDKILDDDNAPTNERKMALLAKANACLHANETAAAQENIQKVIANYTDIREAYGQQILNYIAGKVSADQLLDEAQSWNIGVSEKQHTLCYYYLGVMKVVAKKYDEAAVFWRRCVQLNLNALPEVMQAKQELENLQIRFESRSYQSELFFNDVYLSHLNKLVREQIKSKINPQQKTIDALKFLLNTKYQNEKITALNSIASHGSLNNDDFLSLVAIALKSDDSKLKTAALENLKVLPREASLKLKDDIIKELNSEKELVRRSAVKVLSILREVPPLVVALENKDEYVRRDSGYALAKMKIDATPAAKALETALYDEKITVRDAAFAAIIHIEKSAAVAILQKLIADKNQKDTELRIKALRELSSNHPQAYIAIKDDVVPLLVDILMNSEDAQSSRWSALQLIRVQASDEALEPNKVRPQLKKRMLELMNSYDAQTKIVAASWYLHFHERWNENIEPATHIFISRWQQGTELDQLAVANSFLLNKDRISSGAAIVLDKALRHSDKKVSSLAKRIYENLVIGRDFDNNIKRSFVQSLIGITNDNNQVKATALSILTKYKNDDAEGTVPHLLPFLLSENTEARQNVVEILDLESGDYSATPQDAELLVSGLDRDIEIQKTILEVSSAFDISHEKMYSMCISLVDSENFALSAAAIRILANFPDRKDQITAKLLPILQKEASDPYSDDEGDDDEDYGDDDEDDDEDYGDDDEGDDDEGDDDEDDDDEGDDDEGDDDEDDDDEGDDDEDDDDEDDDDEDYGDDDEDEEPSELDKQDAALYTVGVLNGLDYLFDIASNNSHLVESAIPTVYEVQEKLDLDDADAMIYLSKFFNSDDEDTILAALEEIENVEGEKLAALSALKNLQDSDNTEIRKLAQKLVLETEGSGDLNLIVKWLEDEDEEIRLVAVSVLKNMEIKSASLVAKIAQKLDDEAEEVRVKASEVLVKVGKPAVSSILQYTASSKQQLQMIAIETLGKMGANASTATGKLVKLLRKSSTTIRTTTLQTIAHIATPKERRFVLKPCKLILKSKSFTNDHKVLAWVIVARVGLKEKAINSLIAMLENQPQNQMFIIKNLREIDASYTVQYLKQVIRNRYGSIDVIAAIRILEILKQDAKSAIPVLREMAIDPNPEFSEAAKQALTAIE